MLQGQGSSLGAAACTGWRQEGAGKAGPWAMQCEGATGKLAPAGPHTPRVAWVADKKGGGHRPTPPKGGEKSRWGLAPRPRGAELPAGSSTVLGEFCSGL